MKVSSTSERMDSEIESEEFHSGARIKKTENETCKLLSITFKMADLDSFLKRQQKTIVVVKIH